MRGLFFIMMLLVGLPGQAQEETYKSLINSIEEALPTRLDTGIIQEIDLEERTILVSGFNYFLGPPTVSPPLTVKMLGRDFGALQMLTVGMHVQMEYIKVKEHRIAFEIIQIEKAVET